jgi:alkylhydroperoxidase/carboxymuconolactone decarboxylase family protein YurZ
MYERRFNWLEIVKSVDPGAQSRIGEFVEYVLRRESNIPRKYKELILMACSAALRYGSSIRTHGKEAMYYGASENEVVEALCLASLSSGFTALIDGMEALGDQFTKE